MLVPIFNLFPYNQKNFPPAAGKYIYMLDYIYAGSPLYGNTRTSQRPEKSAANSPCAVKTLSYM